MEISMASRKSPTSDNNLIPRVKQVSVARCRLIIPDFNRFRG